MKKFYSFIAIAVMNLVSLCAFADTTITVNVDDVDRVQVENGYGNVIGDLQNGDNTVVVPQYGTVYFRAKSGALLQKLTKNGNEQYMSSMKEANLYISDMDEGAVIAITSANEADVRTGTVNIKIDDPSKARVSFDGTYTEVQLVAGDNVVKYIPGVETQVSISAIYPNTLYKVLLNDNEVTASYGSYYVTLAEGANIEIQANFPDIQFPVTFAYLDEASKGIVSKVYVDNVEVTNFNDADFKVQAGSQLNISLNTTDYKLDECKVNDASTYVYSNSMSYTVTSDMSFYFAAHKYASVTATLDVDNYDNIIIYKGYDKSNLVEVVDGKVTVLENDNYIKFAPKSGCKITSLTVNGVEQYADYEGAYSVAITEGAQIVVKTYAIVRDKKATVIVKNIEAANYGFSFMRSDRSAISLVEGENEILFSEEADAPFSLTAYGSDLNMIVYLNGEKVNPYYEGGTSYTDINLKDGGLLEIYLQGGETIVGINSVKTIANGSALNLRGQRVDANAKGFVIINGKKYFNK